jgi:hypothetical protein
MIIATKTYEKHETLFLFSCDLVIIAANNIPWRKLNFFFNKAGRSHGQRLG